MWVLLKPRDLEEPSMQTITVIGLDIAKSVFQVHGVDTAGQVASLRPDPARNGCDYSATLEQNTPADVKVDPPTVTINSGATFALGSGAPGRSMTIAGNCFSDCIFRV
jgi:hypothetical protein